MDLSFIRELEEKTKEINEELNKQRLRLATMPRGTHKIQAKIKVNWFLLLFVTLELVGILLFAMHNNAGIPLISVGGGIAVMYIGYIIYLSVRNKKENRAERFTYELALKQADKLTSKKNDIIKDFISGYGGKVARRVDIPSSVALWCDDKNLYIMPFSSPTDIESVAKDSILYYGTTRSLIERRIVFDGDTSIPLTHLIIKDKKDIVFAEEDYETIDNLLKNKKEQ